jgi:Zn ribbon nucleic-acid-binding protein
VICECATGSECKGGGEAKFWVEPAVDLAESCGFKVREVAEAEALVRKHSALIISKWHEYFD